MADEIGMIAVEGFHQIGNEEEADRLDVADHQEEADLDEGNIVCCFRIPFSIGKVETMAFIFVQKHRFQERRICLSIAGPSSKRIAVG